MRASPTPISLLLVGLLAACGDSGDGRAGGGGGSGGGVSGEGEGEGEGVAEGEGEGVAEGEGEGVAEGEGEGVAEGEGEGGGVDIDQGGPEWAVDGLVWGDVLCPWNDDAAQRDADVVLTRRAPDGRIAPIAPGDVVGACTIDSAGGDDGGGVCRVGPEDFRVKPLELIDPGGVCGDPEGCVWPVEAEMLVSAMTFAKGAAAGRRVVAVVVDGSQRVDGVRDDGLVEPARAADPENRRIDAVQAFVGGLALGDRVALYSFGGGAVTRHTDGFLADLSAAAQAATALTPAATDAGAAVWDAVRQAAADARTEARQDEEPVVVLLTAGPDVGSQGAAGAAAPVTVVHLDNPATPGGGAGRDPDLVRLTCETGGGYSRVESPAALVALLADTPLRLGARARLTVEMADVLRDAGPPPGAQATLYVDLVAVVGGVEVSAQRVALPVITP